MDFEDFVYLKRDDESTIDRLKDGDFSDLYIGSVNCVDEVVKYGLEKGILSKIFQYFPDPRKNAEVPIDVVLLTQVIQKLYGLNGMVNSPQLINDPEIFSTLGYAPALLTKGFNDRNKKKREGPYHGEVLKHILNSTNKDNLFTWHNKFITEIFQEFTSNNNLFICDGMEVHIDPKKLTKYSDVGCKKDKEGNTKYGYKFCWIMKVLDNKGILLNFTFDKINVSDLKLAKKLFSETSLPKNSKIIMDRGFLDFDFINELKVNRKIDVFIPLKQNNTLTNYLKILKQDDENVKQNPLYRNQKYWDLTQDDLKDHYNGIFKSGTLVRVVKKNGEALFIPFLSTDGRQTSLSVLRTYTIRTEIEEAHRQLKVNLNLSISKLMTKKLNHLSFYFIIQIICFNLYTLFKTDDINGDKSESLRKIRQKRKINFNPIVVIFTTRTFGLIHLRDLIILLLRLKEPIKERIANILESENFY